MCPHECTSPSDSLEKAKSTMRKSLGMGMIGAELYRWKGVEDANGYYHRGRSQHEILSNAIKMHWDKEACDKAIAAVADAEENKVAELLTFTTTNSAKAGLILRDMDKDTNNETSFRLTLLTRPVQHFLNATLAADDLAVDFMNKQAMDADGPETQKARAALFKANLKFFDGTRGRQVLSEYLGMITDLAGKAWDGWKGSAETKLVYAKKLLLPMVGAWRRLVVPFTDNDAFELLASSGIDGIETYSVEELTRLGLKLEAKMAVCKDCVDQGFASEMLPEIRSNPMFVHDACADNVLMLRVGSGVVERAHRSGQELKPVKSKGIALDAQALAMTTYRKSAIAEGRWLLDKVKGKVLRERNICPSEMARHAKSFRFGNVHAASYKAFGNKKTKKLRLLGGQKKVGLSRRSDGHKKFRRSVWQCEARVGTPEFVAEERRVSMLWSAMSPESKALCDAESKLEDACLLSVPNGSSMNDVNAAVAKAGNVSVGRARSLRRHAPHNASPRLRAEVEALSLVMHHESMAQHTHVRQGGIVASTLAHKWKPMPDLDQDEAKFRWSVLGHRPGGLGHRVSASSDTEKCKNDVTESLSSSFAAFVPAKVPLRIACFTWLDRNSGMCTAEQDEPDPDEERTVGEDFDVPLMRTCVNCGSSSNSVLRCPSCSAFSCLRCFHRCPIRGNFERETRDRSPRRGAGDRVKPAASSASSSRDAPSTMIRGSDSAGPSGTAASEPSVCHLGCCLRPSGGWPAGVLLAICQRNLRRMKSLEPDHEIQHGRDLGQPHAAATSSLLHDDEAFWEVVEDVSEEDEDEDRIPRDLVGTSFRRREIPPTRTTTSSTTSVNGRCTLFIPFVPRNDRDDHEGGLQHCEGRRTRLECDTDSSQDRPRSPCTTHATTSVAKIVPALCKSSTAYFS